MPVAGDDSDDIDNGERLAALSNRHQEAWQRTIDDARALADEREEDGWETLVVMADNTATVSPEAGETDRFGLIHTVASNFAADVAAAFEAGAFPEYDVYRTEVEGRVFLVTELLDPESERAVYLIANYRLREAEALIAAAKEHGTLTSYITKLSGEVVAEIEHDEPSKFFPKWDRFPAEDA